MGVPDNIDNSEWQVRHRHEVATRGGGLVTMTDRQHNHDMGVLIDRLDRARAELVTLHKRALAASGAVIIPEQIVRDSA